MLHYYQQNALNAVLKALTQNEQVNPLVVAPCGSGKSWIIAYLTKQLPGNILVLTHRIKLLRQNAVKIDGGILSASIGDDDFHSHRILTSTYQTLLRRDNIGNPDYIILDECHLVNDDEQSQLSSLLADFSGIPVIGLTATPFRKRKRITEGSNARWTKVYEIDIPTLLRKGYLVPARTVGTEARIDADESSLLEVTKELVPVIQAAMEKHGRKKTVIFCQDIHHALATTKMMRNRGLAARTIHSKQPDKINEEVYAWFEQDTQEQRYLVNCQMLSYGVDLPCIDSLAILRRISTPGTYVQIIGRGMRPYDNLTDCIVLDYGGAVRRFGLIDDVQLKGSREIEGEAQLIKQCPVCETFNHLRAKLCQCCGEAFKFSSSISAESSNLPILNGNIRVKTVNDVTITRSNSVFQICYTCEDEQIIEFVKTKITADTHKNNRIHKNVVIEGTEHSASSIIGVL
ncbi:MAG: hypothetical protein GJ680_18440 [Alteromonadaceae bacterium]|nr:hypothetical protein [Alteromonadaceae bacterium]